jgi:hypothetical protein
MLRGIERGVQPALAQLLAQVRGRRILALLPRLRHGLPRIATGHRFRTRQQNQLRALR